MSVEESFRLLATVANPYETEGMITICFDSFALINFENSALSNSLSEKKSSVEILNGFRFALIPFIPAYVTAFPVDLLLKNEFNYLPLVH